MHNEIALNYYIPTLHVYNGINFVKVRFFFELMQICGVFFPVYGGAVVVVCELVYSYLYAICAYHN